MNGDDVQDPAHLHPQPDRIVPGFVVMVEKTEDVGDDASLLVSKT